MYPFLILCSLSVGFYLFLLVALYRDGRRRRGPVVLAHASDFGDSQVIHLLRSSKVSGSDLNANLPGEASWHPVVRFEWQPDRTSKEDNQGKPAFAARTVKSSIR
jgi:hypothetical protein